MSFLDIDFSDTYEPQTFEAGTEVQARITSARIGDSQKTGGKYLMWTLEAIGADQHKDFNHIFMLPGPSDTTKKVNARKRHLQKGLECFGITLNPAEPVESYMIGAEGWVVLSEEEDAEFGTQNRVKSFATPR